MRKSKEIDIANVSFIDLLAGALGAVMLLFVIVPKVSFSDLEKIESYEQVLQEKMSLDSIIKSLESIVPKADYQALVEKSATLQASIGRLQSEIERVQSAYVRQRDQYNSLAKEYEANKKELEEFRKKAIDPKEFAALQSRVTELTRQNKILDELKQKLEIKLEEKPRAVAAATPEPPKTDAPVKNETPAKVMESDAAPDAVVNISFPLAVVVEWNNPKDKVRLYMRQKGTSYWCFYQTKRQRAPFGRWNKDIQKLSNKTAEAITQDEALVPGEYEIYAQPTKSNAADGTVDVSGYIAFTHPETKKVRRVNITPRKMNVSKAPYSGDEANTYLGTLTVTNDDFVWKAK
jgi:peptidoglycan hydrolase CwlO-like protein